MKQSFISIVLTFLIIHVLAQKQSFDVLSYSAPDGWGKVQNEGGIQLSVTDNKTGGYAIAIITKATASVSAASDNFNNSWDRLVKNTVKTNGQPTMQQPTQDNGWDIISGNASYTEGAKKGIVTLLTATGGSQTVSVVLMTNTQQFQNELLTFLNSLELVKLSQNRAAGNNEPATANKAAVAGLWTNYVLETNGYYINNMPQYTAGYLRKEYHFFPDGTYLFRNKQWLTKAPDIMFIYETGTYTVQGNQLIITPKTAKAGFWGKLSSSKEWGAFKKSSEYKLEKTTYTFEMIYDATYGNGIKLYPGKPTQRDGGKFNAPGDPYEFRYSFREMESLIDNPPGLKTGLENKTVNNAAELPQKINTVSMNAPIAGKIWEGTTTEKFSNAGGTSYNTGGFSTNQYKFNADGTYRFICVNASHYTDTKTLKYETGTYTMNGNKLTITPSKGYNEEWSKIGKTSNGNSDVTNRAINETWSKKLKTANRKLEEVTYTFSIGKNGEHTALMLQYPNGHTEREGNGSQTWLNETSLEKSVKLPVTAKD